MQIHEIVSSHNNLTVNLGTTLHKYVHAFIKKYVFNSKTFYRDKTTQ